MRNSHHMRKIHILSDAALVVQLGEGIHIDIHKRVINFVRLIEENPFCGLVEAVPSYNNVTVFYDPIVVLANNQHEKNTTISEIVSNLLIDYLNNLHEIKQENQRLIEIPVVYGDEYGPDLEYVASYNQITPEEVITYHSEQDYLVYMIGFAPGFPFLGGINEKISTPRKKSPRAAIPEGSVGIAGEQTGIYPIETPGGWQLIGRTAIDLFTPETTPPTLLKPGDTIRFVPISKEIYLEYKENKE